MQTACSYTCCSLEEENELIFGTPIESRYVEVQGLRMHLRTAGLSGPLVLFLHGFPEYSGAWTDYLDDFGRDHRAVAPDLRGYNLSAQPEAVTDYSIDVLVHDLVELIASLGETQATIVAHDWGGVLAWTLAAQHPELVRRLVIINSPHPTRYRELLQSHLGQQKKSEYIQTLASANAEAILAADNFAILRRAVFQGVEVPFSAAKQADYLAVWARGLQGPLNYYRAMLSNNAAPLPPVRVPTLVLWGSDDTAIDIANLDELESRVPNMQLKIYAGASHWLSHEIPERLILGMRRFFSEK